MIAHDTAHHSAQVNLDGIGTAAGGRARIVYLDIGGSQGNREGQGLIRSFQMDVHPKGHTAGAVGGDRCDIFHIGGGAVGGNRHR